MIRRLASKHPEQVLCQSQKECAALLTDVTERIEIHVGIAFNDSLLAAGLDRVKIAVGTWIPSGSFPAQNSGEHARKLFKISTRQTITDMSNGRGLKLHRWPVGISWNSRGSIAEGST